MRFFSMACVNVKSVDLLKKWNEFDFCEDIDDKSEEQEPKI